MAARTARAVVEALVERLRLVIACVSEQPFGRPARLRRSDGVSHVGLEVRLDSSVIPADSGFATKLAGYAFGVLEPDGREILVFHWHPEGARQVRDPHVHLTSRIPPIPLDRSGATLSLTNVHTPTDFLAIADVVRLPIEEFGVAPRRPDWQANLTAAASEASASG